MWVLYLILMIVKGMFGFIGSCMIIRIILLPGFANLYFEGRRKKQPILRNNILFTIFNWTAFYIMGVCGIDIIFSS